MRLFDMDTNEPLDGSISEWLAEASQAAEPTGAVYAIFFECVHAWDRVRDQDVDHYRRMGYHVRRVYVADH
jgi:hypothetical protein